ncbi:hypothetical protein [Bacteroidetes bacterium endosymbiont of Geopemphigus sp.]|uniref:hypothetical protein n=1 Tax=Bacteroidetes bacterium endosymbiont of Geopemphigus sp. TaxID=2047937 RepID=UPI000CD1D76B|nr:hypothetical protein [Bacteroidetes bacterium endosymbiont of Geopemphigus sp.]
MTHEFKTPITTINLATKALENPIVDKDLERVTYYSRLIKNEKYANERSGGISA